MRAKFLFLLLLSLTGCATRPHGKSSGEDEAYARGYGQAVKEQYWIIQNRQKDAKPTNQP